MIGIYKIQNLINGRVYIGQSKDIDQRIREHLYHNISPIDKDIREYGKEYFSFEILERCNIDELDEKEEYYMEYYHSYLYEYGYNIAKGGQHNIGESNANSKLTEIDIYNIRESYKNRLNKKDVYEKYKNKISYSYFSSVWEGKNWKHIHTDVYTEENLNYYKYKTSIGENSYKSVFSNDEVLELRKRYVNETASEIYESVKERCTFGTLQCILWGRYYKNIDIYDKLNKKWIKK